jgi:hypothetical protein
MFDLSVSCFEAGSNPVRLYVTNQKSRVLAENSAVKNHKKYEKRVHFREKRRFYTGQLHFLGVE